jgi:hypothetical protein
MFRTDCINQGLSSFSKAKAWKKTKKSEIEERQIATTRITENAILDL